MPVARHFIGWDTPLAYAVGRFLLPSDLSGALDLGDTLVIVPTRQAGRHLREALAKMCAEQNSALLSPRVVTPNSLLHDDASKASLAGGPAVRAAWAGALLNADLSRFRALFPAQKPYQDFSWAVRTGEMVQALRTALADGGYSIADVVKTRGAELEELERWRDLAALEKSYLEQLAGLELLDPCTERIRVALDPCIPEEVTRIVLAAVPDPSVLALKALGVLGNRLLIDVLVPAPEAEADHFDGWGRPAPDRWQTAHIDIPDPDINVILAASPAAQARQVIAEIAREQKRFGPADIAIGVPDRGVIPYLQSELAGNGLPAFDPADRPLRRGPLFQLVQAFGNLLTDHSYPSLAAFLRQPAILDYLEYKHEITPLDVLQQLDEFQNLCLPADADDVLNRLDPGEPGKFGALARACAFVGEHVAGLREKDLETALRDFLQAVYEARSVTEGDPQDDEFIKSAKALNAAFQQWPEKHADAFGLDANASIDVFLRALAEQPLHSDRSKELVDLEGWLELAWNDAPFLVVTGMNEGSVPDSRPGDAFLPETLRSSLGLRDDARRLARDSFLMRTFIESRAGVGRVCFIAGKASDLGDSLKPSRLLLRCEDDALPARARRLFSSVPDTRPNFPATVAVPLDPVPTDLRARDLLPEKLHVTSLRDYLACPFRFYLKHILRMEEMDDRKAGLDALDFGTLMHDVLEEMAEDEALRTSADPEKLASFLASRAEHWTGSRFGASPPLPVLIALDAAKGRLTAAAREQARLVEEGWEIVEVEKRFEMEMHGVKLVGKIDRLDRHRESGRMRVIDYKTSDSEAAPFKAHLAAPRAETPDYARVTAGNKERRWIDLQLPVYVLLSRPEYDAPLEPAYFNLPKAVTQAGLSAWEGFDDVLADSADKCAKAIIESIQARVFWPPAESVQYDDFERLFWDGTEEAFVPPDFGTIAGKGKG